MHIKETKLNFVLIQNDKILVIFVCLQAKLQLFQEYRALFENFFGSCSITKKNFTMLQNRKKASTQDRQSIRN